MRTNHQRRFASRAWCGAALLLVGFGSMPRPAFGLTLSIPLPQLVGPIDFLPNTGGRAAQFDFGQAFSQINHVWLEVEATVRAREFDVCGTVGNPQECVHVVQLLGFWSIMDDDGTLGTVATDGLKYSDDITDLEGSGVAISEFNPFPVGWDFLLSGKGSLTLFWNNLLGNPDRLITNSTPPSGEIFNARLIIEAVPEPVTWTLLGVALLVLGVGRRPICPGNPGEILEDGNPRREVDERSRQIPIVDHSRVLSVSTFAAWAGASARSRHFWIGSHQGESEVGTQR